MAELYIRSVLLLLALTTDARGQFFDFFQSFDPFPQNHQTARPHDRPSFDNAYYVPIAFNKRTSPNHRSESRRNEQNKHDHTTRKVTRAERTTQINTERVTKNPLKSFAQNNATYSSFPNNNRNVQIFNAPKTDSNRRQNENNPRLKSNGHANESDRHKTAKQNQSNPSNRRNNSKPTTHQNTSPWQNVEVDLTNHKKDKRVPSYENNANSRNSFDRLQISSTIPSYANEINNPFDSSDQSNNRNYYEPEGISYNGYDKPSHKENRPSHGNRASIGGETNYSSNNRPSNINNEQNENSRTKPKYATTQSTSVKDYDYNKFSINDKPTNTVLKPVSSHDRTVNSGQISNDRSPVNNLWYNSKPSETAHVRPSSKRPERNRFVTESPYPGILDNDDKKPANGQWSTSYNERKPISNSWAESPFSGQENYDRPNSRDRQGQNYRTTQNPFGITSSGQHNNRSPTNGWTTRNPFVSGIVKPVGNENRPPITNRPPKYNPRQQTSVTRQPVYDGISFPDDADETPDLVVGPDVDYMSESEKRRYIELAERMCDRYKELDTERVAAIPLVPSPEPVSISVSKCVPTNIPLIVGGKVVSIEEFPHMALLGWKKVQGSGYSWKCGGTLVSDQHVLTAAHCSNQERDNSVLTGPPRVVQLGSSYLDDPGAIVVRVATAIRHPKYKLPSSYYDIAILRLTTRVSFSERIKPACLGVPPSHGHPIIATGWGRTEFGGDQSKELRSVSLPIWRIDECRKVLGTSRKLPNGPSPESQICAGEMAGGKDTCQGDSGGPAQVQDGCAWRVVAVTSVGRACGAARTPALYALVQRAFVAAVAFGGR